ncbi:cupin domain-containing protein [Limimaricola pyoseonensis]|uniref:ChrR-like cupin domain-containing protein n=1 Tax=Limimaricola pyoseonensis TaxID=521013 RepID=A0A1G7GYU2_9RHOB|nr:cupin domain-containing protein [Limimaricola pyoseonensis]SDE93234.1 protein of unknown function [Limimaricola pyoseonensis]
MIQFLVSPRALLMIVAAAIWTSWQVVPSFAESGEHVLLPPEAVSFQPGPATLPEGAQIAVLFGSPAEEGPFVIRLKFPAGYEVPPHRHSKAENVTVVSGRFGMATGESHDKSAATPMAAGGFVHIPAGHPHFAWAEEETVVQINGTGPFDVIYVDEADDPRIN